MLNRHMRITTLYEKQQHVLDCATPFFVEIVFQSSVLSVLEAIRMSKF